MKTKILIALCCSFFAVNGQVKKGIIGDSNWFNRWASFKSKTTEYKETTNILNGVISENTTLTNRNTYLIMGTVYVTNGATLTIEAGTVLRGDFDSIGTIIVTKGSKINAIGSETDPIVFTSNKSTSERKAGDWGGIILIGDALLNRFGGIGSLFYDSNPVYNSFGGTNASSDSGVMKYVRIEYAGKKNIEGKSLNGLTLATVGTKTILENIQISFCADDSIEFVGGNVNLKNIISYKATDDDFDFSMGVQCDIDNSVAIRYPYISDSTRSRCFEIDSYDKLENFDATRNKTLVKASNVTLVNNEFNSQGLVKEAVSIGIDSFLEIKNSVIAGFTGAIALDAKYSSGDNYKKLKIENTIIDSCNAFITNESLENNELASSWFLRPEKFVQMSAEGMSNLFISNDVKKGTDFRIKPNFQNVNGLSSN
jgi:hypothetical protein